MNLLRNLHLTRCRAMRKNRSKTLKMKFGANHFLRAHASLPWASSLFKVAFPSIVSAGVETDGF